MYVDLVHLLEVMVEQPSGLNRVFMLEAIHYLEVHVIPAEASWAVGAKVVET